MKTTHRWLTSIVSLLLLAVSGNALAADSPSALRRQIAKTEQEFYALYNKLNTQRQYEIVCRMDRPTGSNFDTRVCQPRYLMVAQQAHATERVRAATHAGLGGDDPDAGPTSAMQDVGYRNNVLDLIEKNPKLKALNEKRDALQAELSGLRGK